MAKALDKAKEQIASLRKGAAARTRKLGEKLEEVSGTPVVRVASAAAGGAAAGALDAYDIFNIQLGEKAEIKGGLVAGTALAFFGGKNAAMQSAAAGMIGYGSGCLVRDQIDAMLLEGDDDGADDVPAMDSK